MKSTTVAIIAIIAVAILGTWAIVAVAQGLAPEAPPLPAATASPNAIQGIEWHWTTLANHTTGKTESIPSPASYTITFHDDGTVTGKADCNQFSGTYSQGQDFVITLGPTTLAYCGETSLDLQYRQLLSSIVAGGPDGAGNLALETAGGEQRMEFGNGGQAP
jgi:heat shock protein HslJ